MCHAAVAVAVNPYAIQPGGISQGRECGMLLGREEEIAVDHSARFHLDAADFAIPFAADVVASGAVSFCRNVLMV